jgi:hypothetical protein
MFASSRTLRAFWGSVACRQRRRKTSKQGLPSATTHPLGFLDGVLSVARRMPIVLVQRSGKV